MWQELYIFAGMLLKVLRVQGQHPPRLKKCSGFEGSIPQGQKSAQASTAVSSKAEKVLRVRGQCPPKLIKCLGFEGNVPQGWKSAQGSRAASPKAKKMLRV